MMDKEELLKLLDNPEILSELTKIVKSKEDVKKPKPKGRPKKTNIEPEEEIIDLTKVSSGVKGKRGKQCHRVPITLGKKINRFIDDKKLAIEDYNNFDSKIKKTSKTTRPKPKKYKVKCCKCNEILIIHEDFLPPVYETSDDGAGSFICDNCIPGR